MDYVNERIHRIPQSDLSVLEHRLTVSSRPGVSFSVGYHKLHCLYFERAYESTAFETTGSLLRVDEYRISYEDFNLSSLVLQKKSASNGMSRIDSCEIPVRLVETILNGSYSDIVRDSRGRTGEELDPLLQEFYWEVIGRGLRPRTVVDYDTKPYHYSQGNALVTINLNPRISSRVQEFLNPSHTGTPIKGNQAIVHVKWDRKLPDIVRTAFSTFGIADQYLSSIYNNMM